jgi:hypothetical protein
MNTHNDPTDRLKRVDPINAERLISTWSDNDAKASLLKEITSMPTNTTSLDTTVVDTAIVDTAIVDTAIVDTPVSPTPQIAVTARSTTFTRRRWKPLLAVAAALVALGVAIGSSSVGHPARAYAVSQGADGLIHVNVLAGFRDGEALARDLRSRGIRTRVVKAPAAPSQVGKVMLSAEGPSAGIKTAAPDGEIGVFDWTIDPALFKDTMTITIYVEPKAGQRIERNVDLFGPGEKLAGLQCALGEPVRATDVARYLGRVGLAAKWSLVTTTADPSVGTWVEVDSIPKGIVLQAYLWDSATAMFEVLKDGEPITPAMTQRLSYAACTPEAAAPWKESG